MPVINTQETEVKRFPFFFSPVVFQLYDIMLRYATFHHLSLRPVAVFFGFKCALNLVQDQELSRCDGWFLFSKSLPQYSFV